METPEKSKNLIESGLWGRIEKELSFLSEADSFSGREDKVAEYLLSRAAEMGVESKRDGRGNVWFMSNMPEGEILLSAHMDKVGKGASIKVKEGEVVGRLDDALGVSIILSLFEQGLRPTAVFTVEEESEEEVFDGNGKRKMQERDLRGSSYNAGARFASEEVLVGGESSPKLVVIVDVSAMGQKGNGPLIYTSAKGFRFPSEPIKDIKHIFSEKGISAQYMEGALNDSIEFTFGSKKGVVAIELHVDNIHSGEAAASLQDVTSTQDAIRAIILEHQRISLAENVPLHAQPKKGPFNMLEIPYDS